MDSLSAYMNLLYMQQFWSLFRYGKSIIMLRCRLVIINCRVGVSDVVDTYVCSWAQVLVYSFVDGARLFIIGLRLERWLLDDKVHERLSARRIRRRHCQDLCGAARARQAADADAGGEPETRRASVHWHRQLLRPRAPGGGPSSLLARCVSVPNART